MTAIQQQVQQAIDQLVETGAERGLQVAVYQHGSMVVDTVAGIADPSSGRPVTSDTPFFSRASSAAPPIRSRAERAGTHTPA
jgi:CubicO group peptidase (beta-lactamase class C family)